MLNRNADVCITGFSEGWGIYNISVLNMLFTRGSVYIPYQNKKMYHWF